MGFRMRKSFKIAPGVRMTVTPKGVGVSAGVKGVRVSANSSGRVTRTIGVPGTGVSYTSTTSPGRSSGPQTATKSVSAPSSPASSVAPRPGVFAPKWEKDLYKALTAGNYASLEAIARQDTRARNTCVFADAIMRHYASGDVSTARSLLEALWRDGYDPSADAFLRKYFAESVVNLNIVENITVTMPLTRDLLGLALGELRQMQGDLAAAVDVVEQVTPTTIAAVSLAELYADQLRWSDVVDLTNGVANEDDFATYLLIQRGVAMREQGFYEAARESFKAAYAPRSRMAELRRLALIERGQTYLAEGKKGLARKDFEKVLAEDSQYPGLREYLASVS